MTPSSTSALFRQRPPHDCMQEIVVHTPACSCGSDGASPVSAIFSTEGAHPARDRPTAAAVEAATNARRSIAGSRCANRSSVISSPLSKRVEGFPSIAHGTKRKGTSHRGSFGFFERTDGPFLKRRGPLRHSGEGPHGREPQRALDGGWDATRRTPRSRRSAGWLRTRG